MFKETRHRTFKYIDGVNLPIILTIHDIARKAIFKGERVPPLDPDQEKKM